jgi:GLPGLI family protein
MMKSIALAGIAALICVTVCAQQNEGKVIYSRTVQMQIFVSDNSDGVENMLPRSRTDKFELSFANNQTLWKQMEQEEQDGDMAFNNSGGGMQIRMIAAGVDDVMFSDLGAARRVELRELGTKKYIVEDTINRMNWKMSDETKIILGHTCRKALSQRIGTRMMMNMDNGKMERKEISDTSNILVWFTTDIPVSAGPAEFQGQLPGLILEIDVNNGRTVYKALEIKAKPEAGVIKEPKGSKKLTVAEFNKERDKMFEEMSKNNGGPGRTIRISN